MCSDGNNFGSVCNFTCLVGFGIVGSSSSTCGGDGSSTTGSFDNPAPTCEGQLIMQMTELDSYHFFLIEFFLEGAFQNMIFTVQS